jgi:hypothetical protein
MQSSDGIALADLNKRNAFDSRDRRYDSNKFSSKSKGENPRSFDQNQFFSREQLMNQL